MSGPPSWYVYLRPSGDSFVVFDVDPYQAESTYADLEDSIFLSGEFSWCAGSFEEFAYRYWIENRLWRVLHEHSNADLSPELAEYLNQYRV